VVYTEYPRYPIQPAKDTPHLLSNRGKLPLGFNVDPNFSNALDALVLADLRTASTAMLERLMGRAGADAFRSCHSESESNRQIGSQLRLPPQM
jgi:hypothetical protein